MFQILLTILMSAVKFAMTFPVAVMQFRFDFLETILWTNVGGLIGIYFFARVSEVLIRWWNRTFRPHRASGDGNGNSRSEELISAQGNSRRKRIFTRRNRRIVRIKQRYGLIGIAATTPLLLSIPVGTFLVVRYYRTVRAKFIYLASANLVWSVIYTSFYIFWDGILFNRT